MNATERQPNRSAASAICSSGEAGTAAAPEDGALACLAVAGIVMEDG